MAGVNNFGGRKFEAASRQLEIPFANVGVPPQLNGMSLQQQQGNARVQRPYEPQLVQMPIPSASMAGSMPRGGPAISVVAPRTPFGIWGYQGAVPQQVQMGQPPAAQQVPLAHQDLSGDEVHVFEVRTYSDGRESVRPFEAVFPRGTQIMGASQLPPELSGNGEIHVIEIRGRAPNGREYAAPYRDEFPRGTRILGVAERPAA